jgi:hypothetical protein
MFDLSRHSGNAKPDQPNLTGGNKFDKAKMPSMEQIRPSPIERSCPLSAIATFASQQTAMRPQALSTPRGLCGAVTATSMGLTSPPRHLDKERPHFRLNRFLTSCPEIISVKDNRVSGTVVAELPLATAGVLANGG